MTTVTIRVLSVRSQNPRGFGGAIFSGREIDELGNVRQSGSYLVVRAKHNLVGATKVEPGQWWSVAGSISERHVVVDGYVLSERQLDADSAGMLRPSGEHIVTLMAEGEAFRGIGLVKARKLWDCFGEKLFELLDGGDVGALSTVLTTECARQAVDAWAEHGDSRTLQWLQQQGFDVGLGRKVMKFFGRETESKVQEDPYRLLSFCARWKQVDSFAREHFGVAPDDPRRLNAAIEEACYRLFAAGHTTALSSTLMDRLSSILGPQTATFKWRSLVHQAMAAGLTNGSYVLGHHGVQPLGPLAMEMTVAQAVVDRLALDEESSLCSEQEVATILEEYECGEGVTLNAEQRRAVLLAMNHRFFLITGGAGVGKTTVLKAIYQAFDHAGVAVLQMALAGRAAKRMLEGTGRPAATIARFLRGASDEASAEPTVVVIDEVSMVDIISMSLLCQGLPPQTRIILVGDPAQLMPVGPGLVLHALVKLPEIPCVELKVVNRFGGEIALAAAAIRDGRWVDLPDSEQLPIAFLPCSADELPAEVLRLYRQDPENTQILSPRRRGQEGVDGINELCQSALTSDKVPVVLWNAAHECIERVGINLGDPVLCTRNLWDHGIQNGSLGRVVEVAAAVVTSPPDSEEDEAPPVLAWVDWDDGERRPVYESMLDDLSLGYAITVHKAQGSQWPRVIVALTESRMLDRTLIYTAVTRAQRQVILVGDPQAAERAVRAAPRADAREVSLDLHLGRLLRQKAV